MSDDRPLIALEESPDFPARGRSFRYRIVDAMRNRTVGVLWVEQAGRPVESWIWTVTVPAAQGIRSLPPSGVARTREMALADLKAAWLTYSDEPNWPPPQSNAWLVGCEGMGPWQPGMEPRGWSAV